MLRRGSEIAAAVDAVQLPGDLAALFQGASCGAVGVQPGERPPDLLLRGTRDVRSKAARKGSASRGDVDLARGRRRRTHLGFARRGSAVERICDCAR